MKLAIFVLQNDELITPFIEQVYEMGIRGGTVLESRGIANMIANYEVGLFSMISGLLVPETSTTFLFALKDEQVTPFKEICNTITGGLSNPNTGILMIVPLDEVLGTIVQK